MKVVNLQKSDEDIFTKSGQWIEEIRRQWRERHKLDFHWRTKNDETLNDVRARPKSKSYLRKSAWSHTQYKNKLVQHVFHDRQHISEEELIRRTNYLHMGSRMKKKKKT